MSTHNVRGTASGEYECSCGARWDRDEGGRCPATVAVSESPNQCDGCRAGVPVQGGMHTMGKYGGYADRMRCTAKLYQVSDA